VTPETPPQGSASDDRRRRGLRAWAGIAALILVALAVRSWGLQAQSFSMDEVAELGLASASPKAILSWGDGFPPLFALLLHAWLSIWSSDAAARWLTVLLGAASIVPVWALGRRIGGEGVGLGAALLIAVSPIHVWHSQDARGYVLYFLLAALTLCAFYRALDRDQLRDWVAYAVCGAAGMYVHYYFAFFLLVNLVVLALEPRSGRRLKHAAVAHGLLLACVVPLAWLSAPDFASEAATGFPVRFQPAAIPYSYFALIAGYDVGPSIADLHTMPPAEAAARLAGWLAALTLGVAVLAVEGAKAIGTTWLRRLAPLIILPVLVCVPLAGALRITYQVRHVIWVLIPITLVLGAGISRARRRWPVAAAAISVLLVCAIGLYNRRYLPQYANEDVRGLAAFLDRQSRAPDAVFVMTGYMADPVRYYLNPAWTVYPVPRVRPDSGSLGQALAYVRERAPTGEFWLVYVRPFHGDPDGRFRRAIMQHYLVERRVGFPGIELLKATAVHPGPEASARGHRDDSEEGQVCNRWQDGATRALQFRVGPCRSADERSLAANERGIPGPGTAGTRSGSTGTMSCGSWPTSLYERGETAAYREGPGSRTRSRFPARSWDRSSQKSGTSFISSFGARGRTQ
jgi:dolichyl-phosphate-mannose-protein mannosyltransferase